MKWGQVVVVVVVVESDVVVDVAVVVGGMLNAEVVILGKRCRSVSPWVGGVRVSTGSNGHRGH